MSEEVNSLNDLLRQASSRRFLETAPPEDFGLAEQIAFPFLALVGQDDMRLALLLSLVNPMIGGVLLIGPRGTGKTTAVRSLTDLLPEVDRSRCTYGCLPEDVEGAGIDAICPDCAERYAAGEPLIYEDHVRLIELPLNALIEDVIGGLDERAAIHDRFRLKRGILARADQNLLYVDEVNLLEDDIVDAILDAAAQGSFTVSRGALSSTYRSRFVLIGSMNPEEGRLRPQILDRFGLRVLMRGLEDVEDRLEAYKRAIAYRINARKVVEEYAESMAQVRTELIAARIVLPEVKLTQDAEEFGLSLIKELQIDSLRAELTLFEAARAYAAADARMEAVPEDVQVVTPMSLRLRRSDFIKDYFETQAKEMKELEELSQALLRRKGKGGKKKARKSAGRDEDA